MVATSYSRPALLDWVRNVAPDLRLGRAVMDGTRVAFARFTINGKEHELEAHGDEADDQIVRAVADEIRAMMGLPPLFTPDKVVALEQDIVRASLAGDDAQAEALTRELLLNRATRSVVLRGATSFAKRQIW